MENLVFTQLSISEVRSLFRQELQSFFAENQPALEVANAKNKNRAKEIDSAVKEAIKSMSHEEFMMIKMRQAADMIKLNIPNP